MSLRRQDWTIKIEYTEAAFAESSSRESFDGRPRHTILKRGSTQSILIFLKEFDTTVGEALRRLPRHLNEIEKMLALSAALASIEIEIPGHSRPENLVSLSEIAELLQVSRQCAQQLSKQSDFPRPKGTPRSGPVYLLTDAERYRTERKDRSIDRKHRVHYPSKDEQLKT